MRILKLRVCNGSRSKMFNYIGMKVSTANQNLNYVLTLFWIKSELLQITISILCKEYIAFN